MEKHTWFQTEVKSPKGQILVVHGLNNNAQAMLPLVGLCQDAGYDTLLLSLHGHNPLKPEEMKVTSLILWESEIESAIVELEKKNRTNGGKKLAIGFSLGGALIVNGRTKNPTFDHTILLAPSIEVRPFVYLIKLLCLTASSLPSMAPKKYQAQSATGAAAYQALFALIKKIHTFTADQLNDSTTILMDEKDHLVSSTKLKTFIKEKKLTKWNFTTVKLRNNHHDMFTPEYFEEGEWQNKIMKEVYREL